MNAKIKFLYKTPAVAILIAFSLLHLFIVLANHYFFRTFAFDYASYNFAFFDFAHFRISPTPIDFQDYLYPVTFLQDHFSMTFIVLSPLYWLMTWATGTYTLLILQWCFIVSGAWATYRLVELKSGSRVMATLSLIYFFVLFGRYAAMFADCNLAIIGSAAIPVFLYFFETKRTGATLFTFLFLVFNREDYPLWLFFIALFLAILHRKNKMQLRLALIYMIGSLVFFILIFKVFIPALEDEHRKYILFEYNAIGKTPFEALKFMVTHPLKTIGLLFTNHSTDPTRDGVKLEFYILYFLSGGFLLLFRPLYIIPFIPLIAKKMLTDAPVRWSVESYYSIETVSILPLMVFMILGSFTSTSLKHSLGIFICLLTMSVTLYKFYTPPLMDGYGGAHKYNFLSAGFYQPLFDLEEVRAAMKQVPEDAILCASARIAPHMAFRKRIYPYPKIFDAQYILIFKHDDIYPMAPDEFSKSLANLRVDADFTLIKEGKDILFYKLDKK